MNTPISAGNRLGRNLGGVEAQRVQEAEAGAVTSRDLPGGMC